MLWLKHQPRRVCTWIDRERWIQHPSRRISVTCNAKSPQPTRLFSNLNPKTLKHEPGSVWGASALVAGTTVGAGICDCNNSVHRVWWSCTLCGSSTNHPRTGILALPAVTIDSGFVASSVALVGCWVYAVITGLLVAEVNINTLCSLGTSGVSLNSMAQRTLGPVGTAASTAALVFLQYALLIAYTAKGTEVLTQLIDAPAPLCALGFVALLGGLCYAASPWALDAVNTVLVLAVGLLAVVAPSVQPAALTQAHWAALPPALPVMALAFVYQNIVPSITSSLEGDVTKIRTAILLGTSIPLAMFLLWDAAILGSAATLLPSVTEAVTDVSVQGSTLQGSTSTFDPVSAIRAVDATAAPLIDTFTLVAIVTSYIGFVVALSDFFADALNLPVGTRQPLPYICTILPPTALALVQPDLFFSALDVAGTYGVLVLFGILPALMVYSERYGGTTLSQYQLVPGGRVVLGLVGGAAVMVIVNEIVTTVMESVS